jgi:hypothetical protein
MPQIHDLRQTKKYPGHRYHQKINRKKKNHHFPIILELFKKIKTGQAHKFTKSILEFTRQNRTHPTSKNKTAS